MHPVSIRAFVSVLVLVASQPAIADDRVGNRVVFGVHPALSEGNEALLRGDFHEAIQLIREGLPHATGRRMRAAALSNLCAAYSGAGLYKAALERCYESLELMPRAWRTWHNTSRSLIGLGKLDEAIEAAKSGLEIAPNAQVLRDSLATARKRKKPLPPNPQIG